MYIVCIVELKLKIISTAEASSSLPLPAVLTAPIRLDVVQQVHSEFRSVCTILDVLKHTIQRASQRTRGRLIPSTSTLVTKLLPSRGVLVVLLPVFLV